MTGLRLQTILLLGSASVSLARTAHADPMHPGGGLKAPGAQTPAAMKAIAPVTTGPATRPAPRVQAQVEGAKTATPKKTAAAAKAAQAPVAAPVVSIKPKSSDPGLKMEIDEAAGRVVLRGVAKGPIVKRLPPFPDYHVSRGVSFELDRDKMPDFSNEPNYAATNKWYFSHLAETSTNKGEAAIVVANRLAESLRKGGEYDVVVTEADDGSAVLELSPR